MVPNGLYAITKVDGNKLFPSSFVYIKRLSGNRLKYSGNIPFKTMDMDLVEKTYNIYQQVDKFYFTPHENGSRYYLVKAD